MVKAVISVAGFGARFFPITTVLNKAMLPILNRPVVEYLVRDCLAAGVHEIAFVVRPDDAQLPEYFRGSPGLREQFAHRGWEEKLIRSSALYEEAEFSFLIQDSNAGYGTAIPGVLAAEFVGEEDFLLLTGDDLVLVDPPESSLRDLIATYHASGAAAAISAAPVADSDVFRYGALLTRQRGEFDVLTGAVEKPAPGVVPSNLVNISRFLVPARFLAYLRDTPADPGSGEKRSIDALTTFAADEEVVVRKTRGTYFDCGDVHGWLRANLAVAERESATPAVP